MCGRLPCGSRQLPWPANAVRQFCHELALWPRAAPNHTLTFKPSQDLVHGLSRLYACPLREFVVVKCTVAVRDGPQQAHTVIVRNIDGNPFAWMAARTSRTAA